MNTLISYYLQWLIVYFLRLRGILGKKTGFKEDINSSFPHEAPPIKTPDLNANTFDDKVKKDFVSGAKIAYETIISNFAKGSLKDMSLLDKKYTEFEEAIKEGSKKYSSETTFIGISSAEVKDQVQNKIYLK